MKGYELHALSQHTECLPHGQTPPCFYVGLNPKISFDPVQPTNKHKLTFTFFLTATNERLQLRGNEILTVGFQDILSFVTETTRPPPHNRCILGS